MLWVLIRSPRRGDSNEYPQYVVLFFLVVFYGALTKISFSYHQISSLSVLLYKMYSATNFMITSNLISSCRVVCNLIIV